MADTSDKLVTRNVERLEPVAPATRGGALQTIDLEDHGRRKARLPKAFLGFVVLPSLLAAAYFFGLASPIYVSEARFLVRSSAQQQMTPLGAILPGGGLLGQQRNDSDVVNAFIMSGDAVRTLQEKVNLRSVLAPKEADFLSRHPRFWEGQSNVELGRAYRRFVEVGFDANTGISTLRVKAFNPKDANKVAEELLLGAEGVVNRLNERSLRDTLSSAEGEVRRSQERLSRLTKDLTDFRQRERVIDPNRSSVAGMEITNRLAAELASLRAQRSELAAAASESPQLPILDNRIRALAAQVAAEQSRVAGSGDSLAPKIGEFDQMTLERQFADRQLASAMQSLEMARLEAQRQQLYLERISGPGTPDYPTQPNRLQGWLTVVASLLLIYGVARFTTASLREHRQ